MIVNIQHYIKQLKEHEAKRLSTNERNAYWKQYLSKLKEQNNENV